MRRPDWMHPVDIQILHWLDADRDTDLTPEQLVEKLPYRPDYIQERCNVLAEHGLVQPVDHHDTGYVIRDLGIDFLNDDLPHHMLESPNSAHK